MIEWKGRNRGKAVNGRCWRYDFYGRKSHPTGDGNRLEVGRASIDTLWVQLPPLPLRASSAITFMCNLVNVNHQEDCLWGVADARDFAEVEDQVRFLAGTFTNFPLFFPAKEAEPRFDVENDRD